MLELYVCKKEKQKCPFSFVETIRSIDPWLFIHSCIRLKEPKEEEKEEQVRLYVCT